MPTLFQVGSILGLLQGIYDGDIDYKTLSQHGDIGLGTFNGVDGEMLAVDGVFYRFDAQGKAEIADPNALTPFAVVTKSKPTLSFSIGAANDLNELNQILDQYIPTHNIFYMLRIVADLEWIELRSESCQPKPYQPLFESLPKLQTTFDRKNIKGIIVTTRCPEYSGKITIAGYHHHFVSLDKTLGGHVFNLKLKSAQVEITQIRRFSMILMNTKEFDEANLELDVEAALKKTE